MRADMDAACSRAADQQRAALEALGPLLKQIVADFDAGNAQRATLAAMVATFNGEFATMSE